MRAATRRNAASTTLPATALLLMAILLTSCAVGQHVTDYGKDLETNFVGSCTADLHAGGGSTTIVKLADENLCSCVYQKLHETYRFDFAKWTAYEAKQAGAKAGNIPELPTEVTKSINDCKNPGPRVPETTTGK